MSNVQFYEWDYNNRTITEFERLGECNQCGDCCRADIRFNFTPNGDHDPKAGGLTTTGDGVWHEVKRGKLRRFFRIQSIAEIGSHVCPQLTENNQCAIQKHKGLFNKIWPMSPRQVTPFPRCSYSFKEINKWDMPDSDST